jgi:hypothetical protein
MISTAVKFFTLMAAFSCVLSCEKGALNPPRSSGVFYFNSFETEADAEGWEGVSQEMFVGDAGPNSGEKCLNIGGGCIQPAASRVFPGEASGARYRISCWARMNQKNQGGSVRLGLDGDKSYSTETAVAVRDTVWTYCQSNEALFCPKGGRLRIDIMVGGIVFASMRIDGLTITRIP